MEDDKNFRLLIEKENQELQQEIINLKNIVQELSAQAELSGQKWIELTQEKESYSKQTECAEKEKEILWIATYSSQQWNNQPPRSIKGAKQSKNNDHEKVSF